MSQRHSLTGKLFPMADNRSTRTIKSIQYVEDYEGKLIGFGLCLVEGSQNLVLLTASQIESLQYEQLALSQLPCLDPPVVVEPIVVTKPSFLARIFRRA